MFDKHFVHVESLAFERAFELKREAGFPNAYLATSELYSDTEKWYQFVCNDSHTHEHILEINVHFLNVGSGWKCIRESAYKRIGAHMVTPAIIFREGEALAQGPSPAAAAE